MMEFEIFSGIYNQAIECACDYDTFVANLRWQDWMENYSDEQIREAIEEIYTLATSPLRENRERYGFSRAAFVRRHNKMPVRTIEDWELGKSKMPEYTKELLDYSLFIKNENKKEQIKMAKKILVGNPTNTANALRDFERQHGKTVDGYTNLTSINGSSITLNCKKFEDGFVIGFTDEAAYYGSFTNYEWSEEKNTYIKA